MNAFIIHSNKDLDEVKTKIKLIRDKVESFNPLILENGSLLWKLDAGRKIRASQIVLFFIGEKSHLSPYIGWEIKEAIKYNKQIVLIKLNEAFHYHDALKYKDDYTKLTKIYGKGKSIDELITMLKSHEAGDYHLLNVQPDDPEKMNLLFEQYKLFLQTSETLVQRRQNVNNFYITANTALVSLCGTIVALSIDLKYKILIIIMFAIIGIVLSFSWINILISYGNLNSSKMKIISILEKNMPASLFDAEWEVLTDRLNNRKYRSFTESEKRIPQIFLVIYTIIIVVTCVCITYFL